MKIPRLLHPRLLIAALAAGLAARAPAQTSRFTNIVVDTQAQMPGAMNITSPIANSFRFAPAGSSDAVYIFGNTTFAATIVPSADDNSFLGASNKRWNALFLSGGLLLGSGTTGSEIAPHASGGNTGFDFIEHNAQTWTFLNGLFYPPSGTLTSNGVIYQNAAGYLYSTTAGTAGQVLTSNGSGSPPTFQAGGGGGGGITGATSGQIVVATGATTGTSYSGLAYDSGTTVLTVANIYPLTDGTSILGGSAHRWNSVTTSNGITIGPSANLAAIGPFHSGSINGFQFVENSSSAYTFKMAGGLFYLPTGTITSGAVLYNDAAGYVFGTGPGTSGQVLTSNGAGVAPTFQSVTGTGTVTSITSGTGITLSPSTITTTGSVSLTVPVVVSSGGTGATTLTNHGVVLGQGTSAVHITSAGTSGQVLISGGSSADPNWGAAGTGTVTSITAGTGLSGGTITGSGTISLTTPVTVSLGGTGLTTIASTQVMIGNGTGAVTTSSHFTADSSGNVVIGGSLSNQGNQTFNPGIGVIGDTGSTPIPVGTVGYCSGVGLNSATPITLTSGVPANIVSHAFPAGRFLVWGTVWFSLGSGASVTGYFGATSVGSATLPGTNTNAASQSTAPLAAVGTDGNLVIAQHFYSFTTPTTVYEVSGYTGSGGTVTSYGGMSWLQLP